MADAVCIYALAIEKLLRGGKRPESLTNLKRREDWLEFQHAIGKTKMSGFMGEIQYRIQDSTQKRYANSGDKVLEGPDIFCSQDLFQLTNGSTVHLADIELQEDGVNVKFMWKEGVCR